MEEYGIACVKKRKKKKEGGREEGLLIWTFEFKYSGFGVKNLRLSDFVLCISCSLPFILTFVRGTDVREWFIGTRDEGRLSLNIHVLV